MEGTKWIAVAVALSTASAAVVFSRTEVIEGIAFRKSHLFNVAEPSRPIWRDRLGIDVLFVVDYSQFEAFLLLTGNDENAAAHYANTYVATIFEQIRRIYADFHESVAMELRLVGTFIASRPEDCPLRSPVEDDPYFNATEYTNVTLSDDIESADSSNSTEMSLSLPSSVALSRLVSWIKVNYDLLPPHDHAIILTKYDLLTSTGESATQGIAYVKMMCKPGDSSSVVEDVGGMATAMIAAHELAHSLGAFHDGLKKESPDCPLYHNHLMSPSATSGSSLSNSFRLSPCSQRHIKAFLKEPSSWCVHKRLQVSPLPPSNVSSSQPAVNISVSQLCQIAFGPQYSVCPNYRAYTSASICQQVWCKDRTRKRKEPCETKPYLPALDGTSCDTAKWCMRGECVHNPHAVNDCVDLNAKTCAKYSKAKLKHFCKAPKFWSICCASCAGIKAKMSREI